MSLGIHHTPLDGSDIQIETSKEQNPWKNKEIEVGMYNVDIVCFWGCLLL